MVVAIATVSAALIAGVVAPAPVAAAEPSSASGAADPESAGVLEPRGGLASGGGSVVARAHRAFTQVSVGADFAAGIDSEGALWAWGAGGVPLTTQHAESSVPVRVPSAAGTTFTQVAVQGARSGSDTAALALDSAGVVWSWGSNAFGQLGDGDTADSSSLVRVHGLDDVRVVQVGEGTGVSVALDADGSVWCWGRGADGTLGDGTRADSSTPTRVDGLDGVRIATLSISASHVLALAEDGTLWGWGANDSHQVSADIADAVIARPAPATAPSDVEIAQIVAGGSFSMVRSTDGELWGWGINDRGQLGNGTTASSDTPTKVLGFDGQRVADVASANSLFAMARTDDGTVWGWGDDLFAEVGDNPPANMRQVVRTAPVRSVAYDGLDVVGIAMTLETSMVVTSDGDVWSVGSNQSQVGGTGQAKLNRVGGNRIAGPFAGASAVTFGETPGSDVQEGDSGDTVEMRAPAHDVGRVDVRLTTQVFSDQEQEETTIGSYAYLPPLVVESLAPASGTVDGGTVVVVTGTGLDGVTGVTFDGAAGVDVSANDDGTALTVTTPAHDLGLVAVDVVGVNGEAMLSDGFRYVSTVTIATPGDGASMLPRGDISGAVTAADSPQTVTVTDGANGPVVGAATIAAHSTTWTVSPSRSAALAAGEHTLVATADTGGSATVTAHVVVPPAASVRVRAVATHTSP